MRNQMGDFPGGLEDARRSLVVMTAAYGADSAATIPAAALVAQCLNVNGQSAEAEQAALRTLALIESSRVPSKQMIGVCRAVLAQAAANLGRLEEAEKLSEELVRLYESLFGPAHPTVGGQYIALGSIQRRRLRLQAAERSIRRGLDILEKTLPAGHPQLLAARRMAGPATRVRRLLDRFST
jgi:hypothetical protein